MTTTYQGINKSFGGKDEENKSGKPSRCTESGRSNHTQQLPPFEVPSYDHTDTDSVAYLQTGYEREEILGGCNSCGYKSSCRLNVKGRYGHECNYHEEASVQSADEHAHHQQRRKEDLTAKNGQQIERGNNEIILVWTRKKEKKVVYKEENSSSSAFRSDNPDEVTLTPA